MTRTGVYGGWIAAAGTVESAGASIGSEPGAKSPGRSRARGEVAPVLAKLPRAWTDWAYRRARRHGRAIYRAPASAVLSTPGEFTLTPAGAPAAAPANGNGHPADGNGHREAAGFPRGGQDR